MILEGMIQGFANGLQLRVAQHVAVFIREAELRDQVIPILHSVSQHLFVIPDDVLPQEISALVVVTDCSQSDLPGEFRDYFNARITGHILIGNPDTAANPFLEDVISLVGDLTDLDLMVSVSLLWQLAVKHERLQRYIGISEDLSRQASTDSLTHLPNRRAWDEAIERRRSDVLAGAASTTCVSVVDLDKFKQINDERGHSVGDAVLVAAAEGLRRAVRRGDLAARVGGDEFGLLLFGVNENQAADIVERIRLSVNQAVSSAGLPPVTCSVGYSVAPADHAGTDYFFSQADAALQRAKQSGRNRSEAAM